MGTPHGTPRLVPRAESSARARAPRPGLRLVGVPDVRRGARGHYLRHAPPDAYPPRPREPILVGPAPPPVSPAVPPSRELRLLCCEGSCSPGLAKFYDKIPELHSVGFARSDVRSVESATLRHTQHYFVRAGVLGPTVYHTWACTICGNERIYGAFEP